MAEMFIGVYERAMSLASGLMYSAEKAHRDEERHALVVKQRSSELAAADARLAEAVMAHGVDSAEEKRASRVRAKALKMLQNAESALSAGELASSLLFTGMRLAPWQVRKGASVLAMAIAVSLFACAVPVFLMTGWPVLPHGLLAVAGLTSASAVAYYLLLSAPSVHAHRMRVRSLGRAPEAVSYLAMSMSLSPSLDRAVEFAAANADEPLASALRRVLWDVYTRKHASIEESFMAFANEWGSWNDDLKRALYIVRSATLERTEEGLRMTLVKANEVVLTGTKAKIERFVASLSTPTTILFTLGILLPMVVGAMLPMMSLGSLQFGADGGMQTGGGGIPAWAIVLLMDVAFPSMTLIYAFQVLGRRPGTSSPAATAARTRSRLAVAGGIAASLLIGLLAWNPVASRLGAFGDAVGRLPLLWALALATAVAFWFGRAGELAVAKRTRRLEEQFPDALFQLGSRVAEGEPLERALRKVGESLGGSEIGELFKQMSASVQTERGSLRAALFSRKGVLSTVPSRTIQATMATVVEVERKDSRTAGQTIVSISNGLREMAKVDSEIRTQLSSAMGTMKATGLLFAPLIMGVTVALYALLSSSMEGLGAGSALSVEAFSLIMGLFLMASVAVIAYFASGIENGDNALAWTVSAGKSMPIAVAIYTMSYLAAGAMMG